MCSLPLSSLAPKMQPQKVSKTRVKRLNHSKNVQVPRVGFDWLNFGPRIHKNTVAPQKSEFRVERDESIRNNSSLLMMSSSSR